MKDREMNVKTKVADRFVKDNKALIEAGSKMAVAALRVIHDYDGFHRLMLSVSEWTKAIANEGGRAETYSKRKEPE